MHYVDFFDINGVNTKQSACIELHGRPNAATEGKVGVLGVDVDSTTHDVYKCVAVKGSVHTWELLSSGMSVIFSRHSPGPFEGHSNLYYSDMVLPSLYVVKVGDLVIDDMGLLYQVVALGSDHCKVEYCGVDFHGKSGVYVGNGSPREGENVWINPDASEEGAILRVREDPNGEWIEIPAIKGDKGDVGKSAYEYAQDVGYDGTEEEFTHDLMGASEKISALDKRTTVLESAILGDLAQEVVDESMVYSKNIPASALPYASLDTIGGHSFKNNLFAVLPGDTYQSEIGYYNFTVDTDGRLDAYFGADIGGDDPFPKNLIKTNAQYVSLSIRIASGGFTESQYTGEAYIRLTVGDVSKDIKIGEIVTFENVTVDSIGNFTIMGEFSGTLEIMVNEGNTVLPWGAYGVLHSTPVTAVESVGKNLAYSRGWSTRDIKNGDEELSLSNPYGTTISATKGEVISVTQTAYSSTILHNYTNGYITFPLAEHLTDGAKYNLSFDLTIKSNPLEAAIITLICNGEKVMQPGGYAIENTLNKKQRVFAPFTYTKREDYPNAHYIEIRCMGMSFDIGNMMITREDVTDTTYTPCGVVDTFAIPAEVQALEGYGKGISANYNNHIEFTEDGKAKYHRELFEFVFDKSMQMSADFISGQSTYRFWINRANFTEHRFAANVPTADISLCDRLSPVRSSEDMVGYALDTVYDSIAIKSPYSTVAETKEWLHGTKFLLVKAEPEVTDISDMISSDTYIKVEGGGTLTFVNEQGHDVPNKVTFVTKEVSV
jgi:hypothetical protein